MGKYQRFDDMPVWQEAAQLYRRVLDLLDEANTPFTATFRSQLERAALCVGSRVAESFEGGRTNDVAALLGTARGASAEVQSMVAVVSEHPKAARVREPLRQIRASAEICARQLGAWKFAIENPGATRRAQTPEQAPPRSNDARPSEPCPPSRR